MLETAKSKGKVEGKIEGKIEEKTEMILALSDDKIPISQIAKYVRLSEVEVIRILKDHGKM
jgi:predicted transposase YdaD